MGWSCSSPKLSRGVSCYTNQTTFDNQPPAAIHHSLFAAIDRDNLCFHFFPKIFLGAGLVSGKVSEMYYLIESGSIKVMDEYLTKSDVLKVTSCEMP